MSRANEVCGAPTDGRSRYPDCGCETEADCQYGTQPQAASSTQAGDGSLTYAEQRKVVEHMTTELGAAIELLRSVQQRAEAIDCQPLAASSAGAVDDADIRWLIKETRAGLRHIGATIGAKYVETDLARLDKLEAALAQPAQQGERGELNG